jgi:hypothetical protein
MMPVGPEGGGGADRRIGIARQLVDHEAVADQLERPFERVGEREAPEVIRRGRPGGGELGGGERAHLAEGEGQATTERDRGVVGRDVLAIDLGVGEVVELALGGRGGGGGRAEGAGGQRDGGEAREQPAQ